MEEARLPSVNFAVPFPHPKKRKTTDMMSQKWGHLLDTQKLLLFVRWLSVPSKWRSEKLVDQAKLSLLDILQGEVILPNRNIRILTESQ